MDAVLEIVSAGSGVSVQDAGRPGWKRHGVPPGGAMDAVSADLANGLVANEPDAALLEWHLSGGRVRALRTVTVAVTGADAACSFPRNTAFELRAGEEIHWGVLASGVWTYLAVRGGVRAPRWFGSASANPRAGLGAWLGRGTRIGLAGLPEKPAAAAKPLVMAGESVVRVWRGPDWEMFSEAARADFLATTWMVGARSDRTGYRLGGATLGQVPARVLSEPVRVGTVQVPPDGQPLVTLRDGPTVGGYPRLAVLEEVSRFSQCAPGSGVRFTLSE